MHPLLKQRFPLEKWITIWKRQNRNVSIRKGMTIGEYQENRTDMEVWVRRTLRKWFSGRYFLVQRMREQPIDIKEDPWRYVVEIDYWYIVDIRFSFAWTDKISIQVIKPYSLEMKDIDLDCSDMLVIGGKEDKVSFNMISIFFKPTISIIGQKIKCYPNPQILSKGEKFHEKK